VKASVLERRKRVNWRQQALTGVQLGTDCIMDVRAQTLNSKMQSQFGALPEGPRARWFLKKAPFQSPRPVTTVCPHSSNTGRSNRARVSFAPQKQHDTP